MQYLLDLGQISIPTFQAAVRQVSSLSLLLRLDSVTRPGLTETQRQNLLAKCVDCGLVMTRQVAAEHRCEALEGNIKGDDGVLDLTGEID